MSILPDMSDHRPEQAAGHGFDWLESEDLTALPAEELKAHLDRLCKEEREISYRRRVLQGRIDLIRAELVGRGVLSLSAEELARVLLEGAAAPPPEGDESASRP